MKVNHSYLVSALHIDDASGESSPQVLASRLLDYLYTDAGYNAFVALISSLGRNVSSFVMPAGDPTDPKNTSVSGVEEDYFATLLRKITDLRDWQIVDLFDLFDRHGDGIIRTRDLFVLLALIISADARRSTLVFYLHRKEIFEILSRRFVPRELDDDDDDDVGDESHDLKEGDGSKMVKKTSSGRGELGSDTRARSRSSSTSSHGSSAHYSSSAEGTASSANAGAAVMSFAQFCGVGTAVGVLPSRLIAILEKFGVHEGGMFSYQDYLVFGYWVLSHVDAQEDDTSGIDEQQQQSQTGGDSQSSRFCVVM